LFLHNIKHLLHRQLRHQEVLVLDRHVGEDGLCQSFQLQGQHVALDQHEDVDGSFGQWFQLQLMVHNHHHNHLK
jgi:hypothetical protein